MAMVHETIGIGLFVLLQSCCSNLLDVRIDKNLYVIRLATGPFDQ